MSLGALNIGGHRNYPLVLETYEAGEGVSWWWKQKRSEEVYVGT